MNVVSNIISNIRWSNANILRLFLPMILGYGVSSSCWDKRSSKRAGASVAFRPPAYVFGIVWPVLYILLGISWVISTKDKMSGSVYKALGLADTGYISISILLASWIVVYGCRNKKVWGVYAIALSIGSVIFTMNVVGGMSRLFLIPLLTWLLLALLMNVFEVQG